MRNNSPIFWPDNTVDQSIRQSMEKNYTDCINILQTQWYQADVDQRFVMGDQDIWGLIFPGVATYRRKIFNFNLINSMLQMVTGHQRRNRKTTTCIPILSPMQKTSDQLTKCLFHVHNTCQGYQVYSDAFEQGALTSGLGFISIYKDTTQDPISGDIKMRYIDMKACLFDPYFRKPSGEDMRFFWTRHFYDRNEAAIIHPKYADEILSMPKGTYRDDKFYYMPEVYQIQFPNLIAFDEYWYLTSREATFLVDIDTEECQEFEGDEEDLRDIMRQFKEQFKVVKSRKPTVRRSIIINDRVLIDEPNPYGIDRYPIVPVLGYMTADTPYYAYKFRGLVRDTRDAQYLFNRRKVADLDILESQQQGIKMKKGALLTPDDAFNQGNGRALVLNSSASMDDVQHMPIIPPAPTMIQMEDMLKQVMREITGVNEELLGSAVDDKAGVLSMLRQGAGLVTLQRLFDQLDESQRICGEIIIEMIQKNWTYGKVRQVIGEEPTAEFDNKAFFKYGAKVATGVLTETQSQLELQQLLYAKELGIPVSGKRILEKMTLQGKEELLKEIEAAEKQQADQQNQMAQLQMQQLQIDNQAKISYAKSQEGLYHERVAKIQTDRAVAEDKLKRAESEDTQALLNFAKALKELQGMDIEHIERQVGILTALKDMNQPQETSRV